MVTKLNPEVIAEGSITADKINIESLKTDSACHFHIFPS